MNNEINYVEILRKVLTNINNFKKLDRIEAIILTRNVHGAFKTKNYYMENWHSEDCPNKKLAKLDFDSDYPCVLNIDDDDNVTILKVADKSDDYYEFLFDGFNGLDFTDKNLNRILDCMETFQYVLEEYKFE